MLRSARSDTGLTARAVPPPVDRLPALAATSRDMGRPAVAETGASLTLSRDGRLLSAAAASRPPALLSIAGDVPRPPRTVSGAPAVRMLLPLAPDALVSGTRLAAALRQGIEYSGCFYESHLAQWMQGDRTAERLAREPQSRWDAARSDSPTTAATLAVVQPGRRLAADAGDPVAANTGEATNPGDATLRALSHQSPAGHDARPDAGTQGEHTLHDEHGAQPDLQPTSPESLERATLLRAQMNVLDTGTFEWTGPLWPGQAGALAITEERQEHAQAGPGWHGPQAWSSRLRLALHELGDVEARLLLRGTSIALELRCSEAANGRRLAAASPALRMALRARGLELSGLKIDACAP